MEIAKYLSYLAFYIKPYEGTVKIDGKEESVKFYDEREWRYTIPENIIINNDGRMWLTKKKFEDKVFVDNQNKVNQKYCLTFEPKYINYIIVSKENEVLEVMRKVKNIKGRFPYNDVELLATRIISMERINEDF